MSNLEYKQRFDSFSSKRKIKSLPSTGGIFPGYLVIRQLGKSDEYETWIPDHGFEDSYEPAKTPAPAPSPAVDKNDINDLLERLDLSTIANPGDKARECEFFLAFASRRNGSNALPLADFGVPERRLQLLRDQRSACQVCFHD